MRRRKFITLLGSAAAWPLAARAQQPQRMRRIGVLMLYPEKDAAGQLRASAFLQGLEKLGWTAGRNVQIDFHWGVGDAEWVRSAAEQLIQWTPDLIIANGGPAVRPVQQATRTIPIVFIGGADPVADGFVQSFAHPGGNMTGFAVLEPSFGPKLAGLLKEIAPRVTRAAVLLNPGSPMGERLSVALAPSLRQQAGVDITIIEAREPPELEARLAQLGRDSNAGLIVWPDPTLNAHRKLIIELAARHRIPAIYGLRAFPAEGGLMSYGVDLPDLFRRAADYADRILKGAKAGDLPVQLPTKFELVINLKTAKVFGLEIPPTLLATADEVIE